MIKILDEQIKKTQPQIEKEHPNSKYLLLMEMLSMKMGICMQLVQMKKNIVSSVVSGIDWLIRSVHLEVYSAYCVVHIMNQL